MPNGTSMLQYFEIACAYISKKWYPIVVLRKDIICQKMLIEIHC